MENFRTQYFNNLGLKDLALQEEVVDVSKLKQLVVNGSNRTVDKSNRKALWELLLGVVPPFKCVKLHVSGQQREQWMALSRAGRLLTLETDDRAWYLYQIYLLHSGKMPLNFPIRRRAAQRDECKAVLIEAVLGIGEESCKASEMGHYFIVHGILCIINSVNVTKVRGAILSLIKETDPSFARHLSHPDVMSVVSGLVECCYAKSLPPCCMATLLDKVIGGARAMLVYAGADILMTGYTRRSSTHEALAEEMKTVRYTAPHRYCLRGALDRWERSGRPYDIS